MAKKNTLTTGLILAVLMTSSVLFSFSPPGLSRADSVREIPVALPQALNLTSAIWNGTHALIFGGCLSNDYCSQPTNKIYRFDPRVGVIETMNAKFPANISASSAVWTGTYAYITGWEDRDVDSQMRFYRYDPSSDSVSVALEASLPMLLGTSAIWNGSRVYVFGGLCLSPLFGCTDPGGDVEDWVIEYDPEQNTAGVIGFLAAPTYLSSAVWTGAEAYVFGGFDTSNLPRWHIQVYVPPSPVAQTVSSLNPRLAATSAIWDGVNAFLFGGINASFQNPNQDWHFSDDIVRFTTVPPGTVRMSAELPHGRAGTSAVWNGTFAYVFGGSGLDAAPSNTIFEYSLAPAAPANLTAQPGPLEKQVTLTWQAPPGNTYSILTGYKVYRSTTSGGPYTFVSTTSADVTTYVDSGLQSGTTYYYVVTAVNARRDEGPQSNQAAATAP